MSTWRRRGAQGDAPRACVQIEQEDGLYYGNFEATYYQRLRGCEAFHSRDPPASSIREQRRVHADVFSELYRTQGEGRRRRLRNSRGGAAGGGASSDSATADVVPVRAVGLHPDFAP